MSRTHQNFDHDQGGILPSSKQSRRLSSDLLREAIEFLRWRFDTSDEETVSAFLEDFQQRWSDFTLAHLAQAVQNNAPSVQELTQEEELMQIQSDLYLADTPVTPFGMLLMLTALGMTHTEAAREALLPYLKSPQPEERYISAIWLGYLREEAALPVLGRMLTAYAPSQVWKTADPFPNYQLESWIHRIPAILGRWSDPRAGTLLRQALVAVVDDEHQSLPSLDEQNPIFVWHKQRYTGEEAQRKYNGAHVYWIRFEHDLIYNLGRLGAFGALTGIETKQGWYSYYGDRPNEKLSTQHSDRFRANLWRVEMCCGHLEPEYASKLSLASYSEVEDTFKHSVADVLATQFGMSAAEREEAISDFEEAGFLVATAQWYERVKEEQVRLRAGWEEKS